MALFGLLAPALAWSCRISVRRAPPRIARATELPKEVKRSVRSRRESVAAPDGVSPSPLRAQ
eukprot:4627334-Alexandrium_andersonii.AAC.1